MEPTDLSGAFSRQVGENKVAVNDPGGGTGGTHGPIHGQRGAHPAISEQKRVVLGCV